jgi:hypothetical protein
MRSNRPDDDRPTDAAVPEERQAWAPAGYEGGQEVPAAESPAWGPNGFAGTGAAEGGEPEADAVTAPEGPDDRAAVDDDDDPGSHPASVLAGH